MNLDEYSRISEEEKMKYFARKYNHITEQDKSPATKALSKAVQNKKLLEHSASTLKRMIDGKPVNVNPLTEMPEPEMRLYFIGKNFFQTIDELLQYCRVNRLSTNGLGILEYYRSLANCSDVIKESSSTTLMLYTAVDEDGYGIYNHERSVYRGKFTWEYNHGNIREMYKPFKDRGIIFENDIYAKQDERNQQLLKICREKKSI